MNKSKAPLKSTQIQRTPATAPKVAPQPAPPRPLARRPTPAAGRDGAVQRNTCACGGELGADGQCAACRERGAAAVQRKMAVNPPGDGLEQEADQVARAHVQRQMDETVASPKASPIQRRMNDEAMPIQREVDEESKAATVQRRLDDEGMPVQRAMDDKNEAGNIQRQEAGAAVPEVTPGIESGIQGARGGGSALPPAVQRSMEDTMGADLSGVRVHTDGRADQLSRQLNARAFTSGQDIFFKGGEYNPGSRQGQELLAHEAAHTVQQGSDTGTAARAADNSKKKQGTELVTAPGEVDLLGKPAFTPSPEIADFLEAQKRQKALVRVKFGKMAEGLVPVQRLAPHKKQEARYIIDSHALPLTHPLFASLGEPPAKLRPMLVIDQEAKAQKLTGYVGIGGPSRLQNFLQGEQGAQLLGLTGMRLNRLPKLENKLESGHLILNITELKVTVGAAFQGVVNLKVDDEKVELGGSAKIAVPKLADGDLTITRTPEGAVTGEGTVAAALPPQYSGSVKVAWDGQNISGEGQVGYKGEKLSGTVTLRLIEMEKAKQLKKEKQAPPSTEGEGVTKAAPVPNKKGPAKPKKDVQYAVFGEGDLQFAFTEWLNGTAHVIVDHEGYITIIGEITPQKEYELFPQKDYIKPLFKLEARAAYGVPVVGNIFIFANVGLDAFAKLGPVKFYNISVKGNYSTDPQQATEFEIKGSLNVSAAAGLRLRAEAGAGLEVLDHDIKAGAGVNGIAGIRAYAEATPIIGRRAKGNPEEDKKEEYFIRGELEIAGQPFLALSGDLFVELDSPWWSPAPDKKWTWPLGEKEWPVGGTFGLLASVDYVFGSQEYPKIDFKPAEFSAEKFMTDLYEDKAQSKSGEGEPKKSDWKEKNSVEAAPPEGGGKGAVAAGKEAGQPASAQPKGGEAKGTGPKRAEPDARTAEGKSVKKLQAEAAKKGHKPEMKDGQAAKPTGAEETPSEKGQKKSATTDVTPDQKWERGVAAVRQALAYAEKEGIDIDELNRILKSIRKRKEYGFTELVAVEVGELWVIKGSMSPNKQEVAKLKKKIKKDEPDGSAERPYPLFWPTKLLEVPPLGKKLVRVIGAPRDEEEGFQAREKTKLFRFLIERPLPDDPQNIKDLRNRLRAENNITVEVDPSKTKYHMHHVHPLFLGGEDKEEQMIPVPGGRHLAGHRKLREQKGAPDPPLGMATEKRDLYDRKLHPDGTNYELKGDI